MQPITFEDGTFTATDGNITITTKKMIRGLPCFKINQNLFKVI